MCSSGSVTKLIDRVKEGDEAAARELEARYAPRVTGLARARLHGKHLRVADEEDVAQSVFAGFFHGAERGQYEQCHDRDDLWHLLCKITVRKAQKLLKEQGRLKRDPGKGRQEPLSPAAANTRSGDPAVDQIADPNLPPDLEVLANDTIERLLNCLDGKSQLRSIAIWKWENHSNEEIATMLGCSSRTILRKLRLIRTIWAEEELA
jgi:DNA-directed RNA polymerase specialized sigma24 family protein